MAAVEIPKRALFKASEVCEIAGVQPYVLRSWETEFPNLGVAKTAGGPRIYRREDVEKVLRIKQLVFTDGLTLAGVRRRIEEESPPALEDAAVAPIKELLGRNARERLVEVKRGLMSILELLDGHPRHAAPSSVLPASAPTPVRRKTAKAKPAAKLTSKSARKRR